MSYGELDIISNDNRFKNCKRSMGEALTNIENKVVT
jgi:hypothetical protein